MRLARALCLPAAGCCAIAVFVSTAVLAAVAMFVEFVNGVAAVTGVTHFAFVWQENILAGAFIDGSFNFFPDADQTGHFLDVLVASTLVAGR